MPCNASFNRSVLAMTILQTVLTYALTSTVMLGMDKLEVRPFSSLRDQDRLDEICKDVWGGTDYLPSLAPVFEEDPSCDFIVMTVEETGEMVACGNIRFLDEKKSVWIEAIRVSTKHKGRGFATILMQEICRRSREDGVKEIMSCTIATNNAMKKVFGKKDVEMIHSHSAKFPDFGLMRKIPGWSATDDGKEGEVQNILKAYGLEYLVSKKSRSEKWEAVKDEEELRLLLYSLKKHGMPGIGMPGIGKILWISEELKDSLNKGLVRKLQKPKGSGPPAIFSIVKDPAIKSLKSQYVCSIMATTSHDFDSALWEACKIDHVEKMDNNPAFCVIFYDGIPFLKGSLAESLPMSKENLFVFYKWESE